MMQQYQKGKRPKHYRNTEKNKLSKDASKMTASTYSKFYFSFSKLKLE